MTDNFAKELADQSALQLWQAYCDKKTECERLHEVNQVLIAALKKVVYAFADINGSHGQLEDDAIDAAYEAINLAKEST